VPNDKQRLCQQGFSLVEVMIALLIFMVIALGLAQGELAALRAHNSNLFRDEALRVAEDQLNDLKSNTPAPTTNWTTPSTADVTANIRGGAVTFTRNYLITSTSANIAKLTRIDVVVGWNQGNGPVLLPTGCNHQVLLTTIQQQ